MLSLYSLNFCCLLELEVLYILSFMPAEIRFTLSQRNMAYKEAKLIIIITQRFIK